MPHRKREIHVLYIITKLELGDAQKVCLKLFQAFQSKKNTTHLITGTDGLLASTVSKNPRAILLKNFAQKVSLKNLLKDFQNFINLIRHIRHLKKQYHNLIVHTHSTKAGIIGRWAAWCAGVKKRVHTVHGFGFHEYQNRFIWCFYMFLEWITSFITSSYICVSTKDVEIGVRLFPWFEKKQVLIRAAVDDHYFTPAIKTSQNQKPFIFGTVACFKPQKNLFALLEAFATVYQHNHNNRLEIIGDGFLRPQIEAWITKHHLKKAIKLLGWQLDVVNYMQYWNVFVSTSLWEGLPCAVVEARLLQLPVISYDTGGISDVIEHGANGLLVEQKNSEELFQKMLSLSQNNILQKQLGQHPNDLGAFKISAMVSKHYALYQSLL